MDAQEFGKRMVTDDDFIVEMIKDFPDSVFAQDAGEDELAKGITEAAAKHGWDLDTAQIMESYNQTLKSLGALGVIKYLRRYKKALKAAGKSMKDLKAQGIR